MTGGREQEQSGVPATQEPKCIKIGRASKEEASETIKSIERLLSTKMTPDIMLSEITKVLFMSQDIPDTVSPDWNPVDHESDNGRINSLRAFLVLLREKGVSFLMLGVFQIMEPKLVQEYFENREKSERPDIPPRCTPGGTREDDPDPEASMNSLNDKKGRPAMDGPSFIYCP